MINTSLYSRKKTSDLRSLYDLGTNIENKNSVSKWPAETKSCYLEIHIVCTTLNKYSQ